MAKSRGRIGPYSRVVQRGVIADTLDGRSREGRLARHMEAELIRHIGGNPSFVQKLLIERLVKVRLRLDAFEEKFAAGNWTDLDSRTYGALLTAFRLTAREIGVKPAAEKAPSLAELMREAAEARERGAVAA